MVRRKERWREVCEGSSPCVCYKAFWEGAFGVGRYPGLDECLNTYLSTL